MHSSTSKSSTSGVGFGSEISSSASNEAKKQWNIKGLKNEVLRQQQRCFKKISKANERLKTAQEKYDIVIKKSDPSLEELESCPNPEIIRDEINSLQQRLKDLNRVDRELKSVKAAGGEKFLQLLPEIERLDLSDTAPPKPERGPKKVKNKLPDEPRLPYWTYQSKDGIEIRVGRAASDNDELSCNPVYREGADWWMHASGCAGSHVVIRYTDDDLVEKYRDTVKDAALLAAWKSKAKQGGRVPVNLTRCRNVSKPGGVKPGLVYLSGDVLTVSVDMKAEEERFKRLTDSTAAS